MMQFFRLLSALFLFWASSTAVYSQAIISGRVLDGANGEPLVGASVLLEGTTVGTVTDVSGNFRLSVSQRPPFSLVFSFLGYEPITRAISASTTRVEVSLQEKPVLGKEIVVSASLMEESLMQSPVSIEKLDIKAIKQMSSSNFYDGLSTIKGVDLSVHSLLFKVPNVRGFNGNTGVRMGQVVDGMDNTVPGLSFAAGNIFGVGQLDIESVEFLVGASSALYGPGSMNGTLLMTSKNPFEYEGLSASFQAGVLNVKAPQGPVSAMQDLSLRYAKAFNDKWAFKISVGYFNASDWRASDTRDRTDPSRKDLTRQSNEGYDGVNVYGDDIVVPVNLSSPEYAGRVVDGLIGAIHPSLKQGTDEYQKVYNGLVSKMPNQIITRAGYGEKYFVDYGTRNVRTNAAVHYRIRKNLEAIAQVGYSNGNSLYTAESRFSLRNFGVINGRLEIKSPVFYVRTYAIAENAGDSYDAANTALLMNEAWKPSADWYKDYLAIFAQKYLLDNWTKEDAYQLSRQVADNRYSSGLPMSLDRPSRPLPGTSEFASLFNNISKKPISEGGTKVIDKSVMWHTEGMYNFKNIVKFMEIIVGGSYRMYSINSEGTIFADQPGSPISINQFGAFLQLSKKILSNHVKLLASARYDKNEFFKGRVTPRASIVYSIDDHEAHNVRFSFQTAFRFPTVSDQWEDINTGPYRIIGGQDRLHKKYNFDTNPVYALDGLNPVNSKPILDKPFSLPTLRPEEVMSFELGYKGLLLSKMLLIDGYVYRNEYSGFLAQQAVVQNPNTTQEKRYLTFVSTDFPVITYGWALGVDVMLMKGFVIRSNVNYNTYELAAKPPAGFRANFNTPAYRYNVSLNNNGLVKNMNFNVNWRWQQGYRWESSFGVADMPAFGSLDASVGLNLPKLHSALKVGGSNLLNQYYTTSFGSAQVGGLYYVTWTLERL